MAKQARYLVTTLGREAVAKRLSEHVLIAQREAMAYEAKSSYGLAVVRWRDARLLHAMQQELEHPNVRSDCARRT